MPGSTLRAHQNWKVEPMANVIIKVDQEPGRDRYLVWSTCIDGPTIIGTRRDMIAWLEPPTGDARHDAALRIMSQVDAAGTSDRHGRFGWYDTEPIPVGDIAPDNGWYRIIRDNIPDLVDAIVMDDREALVRTLTRYV